MSTQPLQSPSLPSTGGGPTFPVGYIMITADATNPATWLGYGTWSAIGPGRVLVGFDGADADFNTLGGTGGAKTASHSHTSGTLTTDTITSHAHGAGTLAPSAHSGAAVGDHNWGGDLVHQHFAGTLAPSAHSGTAVDAHAVTQPSAHPNHKHELKVGNLPQHTHPLSNANTAHTHPINAGQGSHQHGMAEGTTDGAGTFMDRSNAASATTAVTDFATLPAMTANSAGITGTTDAAGAVAPCYTETQVDTSGGALTLSHTGTAVANHVVTQPSAHTMSGNTGNIVSTEDPIVHVVTQPSAHTMSGSTSSDGAHGHNVNAGSTGPTASSTVQPYLVVTFWQRTL